MNAEQKQRAAELLAAWRATAYALHADRMADLLQELIDAPEVEPVACDLRMNAYYYCFDKTGILAIDRILSAIACAGKAYHHTECWNDETTPYTGHVGTTPVEWIQNAANDAAKAYTAPPAPSVPDEVPDAVIDAVADAIGGAYDCLRVWSAWEYGTMGPDDFLPVTDDADRVAEIARAALSSWLATAPTPAEPPADVARDAERLDWLLRKLPGVVLRYCVGVLSDTSDGKEFREAIDAAMREKGQS